MIRQLGDEDFRAREAATKRLSALALDPPPEVIAATRSDDPEVRDRAKKVAAAMRLNIAAARLPRGEGFARRGDADLFVAATAQWELKPSDPRLWEPALNLGRTILEKAEMTGKPRPALKRDPNIFRAPVGCPALCRDLTEYKTLRDPRLTRVEGIYQRKDQLVKGQPRIWYPEAIQAAGVQEGEGLANNLVISRGPVNVRTAVQVSVVFANGNVTTGEQVSGTVIVCDGDVEVSQDIGKAVVIARGNITARRGADTSVLIAGGKVTIGPDGFTDGHRFNVIKENETNPLGFITFFELARVGLEAKTASGAVAVATVKGGSAGEKAGLKVGDAVLDVNGKKPTDAESLRRLLRDALAVGDATVKLKRGNETVTVKLSLPE